MVTNSKKGYSLIVEGKGERKSLSVNNEVITFPTMKKAKDFWGLFKLTNKRGGTPTIPERGQR